MNKNPRAELGWRFQFEVGRVRFCYWDRVQAPNPDQEDATDSALGLDMSGRRTGQWWISCYGQIPDTTPKLEHRSWHQSLQIHRVMIICGGLVNGRRKVSGWFLVYCDWPISRAQPSPSLAKFLPPVIVQTQCKWAAWRLASFISYTAKLQAASLQCVCTIRNKLSIFQYVYTLLNVMFQILYFDINLILTVFIINVLYLNYINVLDCYEYFVLKFVYWHLRLNYNKLF
jgi:hypothetical protein